MSSRLRSIVVGLGIWVSVMSGGTSRAGWLPPHLVRPLTITTNPAATRLAARQAVHLVPSYTWVPVDLPAEVATAGPAPAADAGDPCACPCDGGWPAPQGAWVSRQTYVLQCCYELAAPGPTCCEPQGQEEGPVPAPVAPPPGPEPGHGVSPPPPVPSGTPPPESELVPVPLPRRPPRDRGTPSGEPRAPSSPTSPPAPEPNRGRGASPPAEPAPTGSRSSVDLPDESSPAEPPGAMPAPPAQHIFYPPFHLRPAPQKSPPAGSPNPPAEHHSVLVRPAWHRV